MSQQTAIEWTDATWNPVTGCSKVSPGCAHCYAETLAKRLHAMGQGGYTDLPWTPENAEANVILHPDRLDQPLRWRKPRMVFVNSMSDLFHEQIPDAFIVQVFPLMASSSVTASGCGPPRASRGSMSWDSSMSRPKPHVVVGDVGLRLRGRPLQFQ